VLNGQLCASPRRSPRPDGQNQPPESPSRWIEVGGNVTIEMEIEDGLIRVYGVGEDGVQSFTDFGIENLIDLLRMHKENPTWLKRWHSE
jgi:hypothetical protein